MITPAAAIPRPGSHPRRSSGRRRRATSRPAPAAGRRHRLGVPRPRRRGAPPPDGESACTARPHRPAGARRPRRLRTGPRSWRPHLRRPRAHSLSLGLPSVGQNIPACDRWRTHHPRRPDRRRPRAHRGWPHRATRRNRRSGRLWIAWSLTGCWRADRAETSGEVTAGLDRPALPRGRTTSARRDLGGGRWTGRAARLMGSSRACRPVRVTAVSQGRPVLARRPGRWK